jgi:hypothetical protein
MYKIPWNERPLITGRGLLILLVLFGAAVLGARYLVFVAFAGTGVDQLAFVARAEAWRALRYRECMGYGVLWLLTAVSLRLHHRGLFPLLLSSLMLSLGYFELVIRGLLPFAGL